MFTVLLATYNGATWVRDAMMHIQAQTFPHFECLILDNASTDNTQAIVKDFIEFDINKFYYLARTSLVKDEKLFDRFDIVFSEYFKSIEKDCFYPYASIVFEINEPESHYHVPLLISGFGFSTYRGS